MAHYDARDLNLNVDSQKIKELNKTKPYKHGLAIAFNWLVIISCIYLCDLFFNPLTYIIAIIIIGARMHALAILMHDATHFRFLRNRKLNDLITNVTSMYPLFTSIEKYRANHLPHHKYLNTDDDPDWSAKLSKKEFKFPKSKKEFIITILLYFTIYQGVKDVVWILKRIKTNETNQSKKAKKVESKIPSLAFIVLLFGVITLFGLWKYYLLFWLAPFLSTLLMFQYIRSVSEHFGDLEYDHLLSGTRTVKVNFLEAFIFAPHNVSYHIEHHMYSTVPFYNLLKLHDLLMQDDEFRQKAHITHGYLTGLLNDLGKLDSDDGGDHVET
jgi:fatty acid desaturase